MHWDGDEKRIRALFSELSFEDQDRAPRFNKLWRQAEAGVPVRHAGLTAIAVAVVVIIVVVSLVGVWSRFRSTQSLPEQQAVNLNPQPMAATGTRSEQAPNPLSVVRGGAPNHRKRLLRRPSNNRIEMAQVAVLSSWQSPTAVFLEPPALPSFNSLPQLNQSVEDLKSFLPKANQVPKESNQ